MNGQLELFPPGEADGGIYAVRYVNEYGNVSSRWLCLRCQRGGMTYSGGWGPGRSTLRWARKHHRCRPFGSPGGRRTRVIQGLEILPDPVH